MFRWVSRARPRLSCVRLFSSDSLDKRLLRNIGVIAHVDAGKTTLTERMLFYAGVTRAIGVVVKGNTVTDWMDMERDRGITIVSAAITFNWLKHRFNLVDTPGHVDFTVEVERSVRVLDGAVAVIDAVAGVQAQTETVWRQADRHGVARIAFINKYDREGASLDATLKSMRHKLKAHPLALQLPVGTGVGFRGVIDLIRNVVLEWPDTDGKRVQSRPLNESEEKEAEVGRQALKEGLCEVDETFLEAFLGNDEKCGDSNFLHAAIRRATINLKAVPCLVGSAYRNKGVQGLMDSVVLYLPSPLDVARPQIATRVDGEASNSSNSSSSSSSSSSSRKKAKGDGEQRTIKLHADNSGPLVCLAWKVVHDHRMGLITYFRVISGTLQSGKMLRNSSLTGVVKERPNKLVILKGQDQEIVPSISAGNIGAIIGLKQVSTGDTLMDASTKVPLVLPRVDIPPPVFFRAIEPFSLSEQDKLDAALALLNKEDPSFTISTDAETGQTLVGGMGELHLEYILDRLQTHYKVEGSIGDIMIAYRCAPKHEHEERVQLSHTYDSGNGKTVHGDVDLTVFSRPIEEASNHVLVENGRTVEWGMLDKMTSQDKKALLAITEGVGAACNRGNSRGHPMVNIGVVVEGWSVEGDMAGAGDWGTVLQVCAEKAVRQVFGDDSVLSSLEPAMTVQVRVESDCFGSVSADLTSARRGFISEVVRDERHTTAFAVVPLKEMIGYSSAFRQRTGGRGTYTMEFKEFVVTNQLL